MHEKEWDEETQKPSGYLKALGAAAQLGSYAQSAATNTTTSTTAAPAINATAPATSAPTAPVIDTSKSHMKPYFQKDHAWTHEQRDHMHEREWDEETKNPSDYLKSLGAAMQLGYPGETNS